MAYSMDERVAEYRARAEELRILAAALKFTDTRADLIGLAARYERMAESVKRLPGDDEPHWDY